MNLHCLILVKYDIKISYNHILFNMITNENKTNYREIKQILQEFKEYKFNDKVYKFQLSYNRSYNKLNIIDNITIILQNSNYHRAWLKYSSTSNLIKISPNQKYTQETRNISKIFTTGTKLPTTLYDYCI